MTTTQEYIDGLISSIWNAQLDRSVTNIMVARVLDWLNAKQKEIQKEMKKEILRLVTEKVSDALGGLSLQEITEEAYEALVESGTADNNTLYLVKEEDS